MQRIRFEPVGAVWAINRRTSTAVEGIAVWRIAIPIEWAYEVTGVQTPTGPFGHFGAYSLQNHKTVTTGEGGIVVTDNARLRTNSIRKRAVHLDIHPLFTDRDVEDITAGIRKVARAVL